MKHITLYIFAILGIVALIYYQKFTPKHTAPAPTPVSAQVKKELPPKPINHDLAQKSFADLEMAKKAQSFSVEFADNSAVKGVSLSRVKMNVRVYYYNNPDGILEVQTDGDGKFGLNMKKYKDMKSVALEIVHIDGQEKYKSNCFGQTIPGSKIIKISCSPPDAA